VKHQKDIKRNYVADFSPERGTAKNYYILNLLLIALVSPVQTKTTDRNDVILASVTLIHQHSFCISFLPSNRIPKRVQTRLASSSALVFCSLLSHKLHTDGNVHVLTHIHRERYWQKQALYGAEQSRDIFH